MGIILKWYVCKSLGFLLEDVYYVIIMFCYDKKFEVVCEDFIFEVEGEGLMEGNKL